MDHRLEQYSAFCHLIGWNHSNLFQKPNIKEPVPETESLNPTCNLNADLYYKLLLNLWSPQTFLPLQLHAERSPGLLSNHSVETNHANNDGGDKRFTESVCNEMGELGSLPNGNFSNQRDSCSNYNNPPLSDRLHNSSEINTTITNNDSNSETGLSDNEEHEGYEQCSYTSKSVRLKTLLMKNQETQQNPEIQEIFKFAHTFRLRRLTMGLTQTQVGDSLNAKEGPAYSQSAICRFEKLDVTLKSAKRMKPVLQRWLMETESRYSTGTHLFGLQAITKTTRQRKRRTCFSPNAIQYLTEQLRKNPYPLKSEMDELAHKLNYDREVIRVWFCNRRQAIKHNTGHEDDS